jgi:hypothetical protein
VENAASILAIQNEHCEAQEVFGAHVLEVNASIDSVAGNLKQTTAELRNSLATNDALATVRRALGESVQASEESMKVLESKLLQRGSYNADTFCTKADHSKDVARILTEADETNAQVTEELERIQRVAALRMQEQSQIVHDEYESQQAANKMMRERHINLDMKESRQFAKHESLESSVKSFRRDVRKAHDKFESEHRAHDEAQNNLEMNLKAESEAFLACDRNFASFKVLTADNFRKRDLLHQRAFAENAAASDKISKHDLTFQRLYAELCIPTNTMPGQWGNSPALSPAQTPTPGRSSVSPALSSR